MRQTSELSVLQEGLYAVWFKVSRVATLNGWAAARDSSVGCALSHSFHSAAHACFWKHRFMVSVESLGLFVAGLIVRF